ncbi:Hypothetical protein NTJ_00143 [Nesidiocoris tenuis]|uniref:Reverse transcriptase domain-containing protein n=1 Tax=Nesidiocoris tenuis TaxID=355587 RepID=A0ABN7A5D5_9HEMI|nr:Hypothetical protein NTJ_00143 [Nesidiocoris tenuis]
MVSFDVVSLFTNVPLEIVIIIVQRNWSLIEERTAMPLETFLDLLSLTCMQGFFKHKDVFVRQISGVAMGGVLSSDVAGLVMVDLLNWVKLQLPFGLRLVRRYVDDLFLILPTEEIDNTLAIFNSYHGRLKFTCEREVEGRLLDVMVVRDPSGTIGTDWYRKPSASDRCMDFRSAHAYAMKIACAKELIGRALRLSSPQYRNDSRVRVMNMLVTNGYPKSLVTRIVNEWSPTLVDPGGGDEEAAPQVLPAGEQRVFYAGLTYIQGVSPRLRSLLQKELPGSKFVFRCGNKVARTHTKLKAVDPIELQSGVVYKVACRDCNTCYVGQTISYVKVRMARHNQDCNGELNQDQGTMLSHHALTMGHVFDFGGVKILDVERKRA